MLVLIPIVFAMGCISLVGYLDISNCLHLESIEVIWRMCEKNE
jgi:hypothetical protein